MIPTLALILILASSPDCGATPPAAHALTSSSILLHMYPQAWRPPGSVAVAGFRFDPESGDAAEAAEVRQIAAARHAALANLTVQTRADGSRYLTLGGLVRAYVVATVTPDGRLVEACVQTPEEVVARVNASRTPSAPTPRTSRREE